MLGCKGEDRDWLMAENLLYVNSMLKNSVILSGCLVSAVALLIGACAQHHNNVGIPVPSAKMAKASGKPLDTLGKGYSLFQAHCAQCHELKMPENMRVEEWHVIVPGMAWNAGLEKEDEDAIMEYLVAATQQIKQSE